jgi:hypothetical protein
MHHNHFISSSVMSKIVGRAGARRTIAKIRKYTTKATIGITNDRRSSLQLWAIRQKYKKHVSNYLLAGKWGCATGCVYYACQTIRESIHGRRNPVRDARLPIRTLYDV